MTTIPTRTEITIAAKEYLLDDTEFLALIGTDVGSDLTHGDAYPDRLYNDGWVFVGVNSDGRPVRDPSGTGTSAVTMDMYGGPWGTPNRHNTAQFPVLRVIVWSDPTRPSDNNGLIAVRDAEDRCNRIRAVITRVFHDPGNTVHAWGSVPIISCLLGEEQPIRDVAPYDGMVQGVLRFNVEAF